MSVTRSIVESMVLLENWGNLQGIPKEFMRAFKMTYNKDRAIPGVGRDSAIVDETVSTAAEAQRKLKEPGNIGVVAKAGDEYIGALGMEDGDNMSVVVPRAVTDAIAKMTSQDPYRIQDKMKDPYQFFNLLNKYAKSKGKLVTAQLVKRDTNRTEIAKSRAAARRGSLAIAQQDGRFEQSARQDLQRRLAEFKRKKAPTVTDLNQFIDMVKKSGYVDNITIGPDKYELDDISVSGRTLFGKRKSTYRSDQSFVTYKRVGLHDYSGRGDNRMADLERRERDKVPNYIRFYLKLDGPNIVIDRVEGDEN